MQWKGNMEYQKNNNMSIIIKLPSMVQESAKPEIQTSLMSIASTGARLMYIPLVFVINYL